MVKINVLYAYISSSIAPEKTVTIGKGHMERSVNGICKSFPGLLSVSSQMVQQNQYKIPGGVKEITALITDLKTTWVVRDAVS